MKLFLVALLLVSSAILVQAQEQERKLVDRLLRPDVSLQNPSQKKKFSGTSSARSKKAPVREFAGSGEVVTHKFLGLPIYKSRRYPTAASRQAQEKVAVETSRLASKKAHVPDGMSEPETVATSTVESRDYAESRPFLARGKSQKAISQKNKPLTIDEVRELLNKQ